MTSHLQVVENPLGVVEVMQKTRLHGPRADGSDV